MTENRTEMKRREYLIGDMSEIVGISRDTLRFYEKKGIIKSRKKENGYRYYLEEDILRLMFIVYRRKMNQSLEEIERYIKEENSLECMKEHLAMRIKQEEASIQYHQQAIARMQLAERDMDQAEKYEGKYTFKNFPTAYKLGVCESLLEGLKKWFAMSSTIEGLDMTYFYNMLTYTGRGLAVQGTRLLLYKGLEPDLGEGFNAGRYPMTEEKLCLYTVLESGTPLPSFEMIQRMVQWGHKHGIETEGLVYANDMTSFFAEEGAVYCLEVYMPARRILSQI